MITLAIYTHAGPDVGLGHYRRMLVLLSACVAEGINAQLYLRGLPPKFINISQSIKSRVHASHTAKLVADITVIDGVSIDDIDSELLAATLLVQIDDNGSEDNRPDVFINPNLYGDSLVYPENALVLAGKHYNLIADDFFIQSKIKEGIVVSFGGSDDGDLAINTAVALRKVYHQKIQTSWDR